MLTPQEQTNHITPLYSQTAALSQGDLESLNFGSHQFRFVSEPPTHGFYCEFITETCELILHRGGSRDRGVKVDFEFDYNTYKLQKLSPKKDLLARAIGTDTKKVCDLTLGLAQDAFKLCYFGMDVTGIERNPIVAALVKNALERSQGVPPLSALKIHFGEMNEFVKSNVTNFEAFYLDPMFSHKRTALPKKEMQYLSELTQSALDDEYTETVNMIRSHGRRLVIKRPRQEGALCGIEPHHSLEGKMVRFDVYMHA